MKPQLTVIDSLQGIRALRDYLKDFEYVAFDTETTGLTQRDEIIGFSVCAEESKAFYVIAQRWDVALGKLVLTEAAAEAKDLVQDLTAKQLIAHNGTFDCMMVAAYYKVRLIDSLYVDTMILAHLLDENQKVGLKDLASRRYGDSSTTEQAEMKASILANGGIITKGQYELYKGDADLIAKYGAKDAWLTYKLFLDLIPELYEQGLDKFFFEDESMPLLRGPTYELNTVGLQVDTMALLKLKKTLESECLQAKDFIHAEIHNHVKEKYPSTTKKNVFNIGAGQQLGWLLFEKLGLEPRVLTDSGRALAKSLGIKTYTPANKRDFIATVKQQVGAPWWPEGATKPSKIREPWAYLSVDKETLKKLAPKYKWIERLLEYQRKSKLLSTYVEGIEERVHYGIIQPSFLQHGTTSGRYACRSPNFQNLPRDDKRIKECIVARPGRVFVGADYSQLEPRVFAYVAQDQKLMDSFNSGDDFYSVIGIEVYEKYDCAPKKDGVANAFGSRHADLRQTSKVIALASTYGASAYQLAPVTGKSIEDTELAIAGYFARFPDVRKMMLESHEQSKRDGQVVNLFGRPRRIPQAKRIPAIYGDLPHEELPYEARGLLNLSVNHRIQSTGASIVNRAAILFHANCKKIGIICSLVLQVHDSIVVECDEADAENVSMVLRDAMENAVELKGIRLEAVPKIGRNLAEV